MTTNKKDKSVRIIYQTPAFRLSYPALFAPKDDLNGNPKYSAQMLFPKTALAKTLKTAKGPGYLWVSEDNLKGLYMECVKVAKQTFGPEVDLTALKMPNFRDGDKPKSNGSKDDNAVGMIVINASSKEKPRCLRQDKTDITDESELYPGCWCRAVLCISAFNKPMAKGVTLYLNGIQKLADDQTFSGRPRVEDVFDDTAAEVGGVSGEISSVDTEVPPWMEG